MKVLFISNDPYIFLAESAVRKRLREYAQHFTELHVVSAAPRGTEKSEEGNVWLYPVVGSVMMRGYRLTRVARALIRARAIDVVSTQDPFEHGLVGLCATLRTPARLHVQVHTDFLSPYFSRESLKNRLRVLIARLVLWFADGVRVVSERIKQSIRGHVGGGVPDIAVIPIAVSAEAVPPEPLPVNTFMFSFLTASRLEKEKHIEDILTAFVLVRRAYPHAGLFIAGEGREQSALTKLVEALDLQAHVVFLGRREDVRGLLQRAQAYVCASAYEGYGLSLVEAALAGTPIVTTEVGVVGDVLIAGTSVLTFPVGDRERLAEEMIRLIENTGLRDVLRAHAKKSAEAHVATLVRQPELVARDIAGIVRTDTIHRP